MHASGCARIGLAVTTLLTFVLVVSVEATAATPQTITLVSGNGDVGGRDAENQVSEDRGATWEAAYIIHPAGAYDTIPDTKWITGKNSPADETILYRRQFEIPMGATSPSAETCVHADNAAAVWINGQQVGAQLQEEIFENFQNPAECYVASGAPLLQGMNLLEIRVLNFGPPSGLDYKMTITYEAPSSDTTPPTTTASASPAPNAGGWNNADVTVSLTAQDNQGGSGVERIHYSVNNASCSPSSVGSCNTYSGPFTMTSEGRHTVRFFSKDRAGNVEQVKTHTVRIDKTAPSVSCGASPSTLWPPNHRLRPVAATVSVSDALSGPVGFRLTSTRSSEPDSRAFAGDVPGDIQGWTVGTPDTSGQLRAERDPKRSGRIYTLRYTGLDVAGNSAACDALVRVPHDRSG